MRDLPPDGDDVPEQLGEYRRIAVFGGVYSNDLALGRRWPTRAHRDVEAVYCLGDLGGFGPHPDRVFPLLREPASSVIQGNYDESLASGRTDCGCGYTDPRDNHFARISYSYTFAHTSAEHKAWLGALPPTGGSAGAAPGADVPRLAARGQRVPVGVGDAERAAAPAAATRARPT